MGPIVPFEPILSDRIPTGDRWIYQIKWDGVRMLLHRDGGDVRLFNRKRSERTAQYPEFRHASPSSGGTSFILDGEMIAFDESKPSFPEVMRRDGLRRASGIEAAVRRIPVVYMAFDIVYCDGEWTTGCTLEQRQRLLNSVVKPGPLIQVTDSFPDGEALLHAMKARGMEGIVAKSLDSEYAPGGKDGRWVKIKLGFDLYAAAGGVTYRDGRVNALLLGLYAADGSFVFIGKAGGGSLTSEQWAQVDMLASLTQTARMPFSRKPDRVPDAVWIEPTLVVKVSFLEWTQGGTMRQPVIQAVMEGMEPAGCLLAQTPYSG
ncbi:ATP-dependent DNA ligase [Cohnella fermenti]|uniref:DNA ligase (ATP) n=1 Tax=Cohnella fermenti TaxID=2565925 RepID=A0A4S4BJE1_9BACL|nr:DNA ligase [Cohnella fermenti]